MKRFALNSATTKRWPLPELVAGCVDAGVFRVGLWREDLAAYGVEPAAALVRDAGLTVTSLCRGG
ncbi:sugar phosphate isomerase/epimerase, partial [Micromonospora sp. NPDC000018]